MTEPEPRLSVLLAADSTAPTTVVPWSDGRTVLAETRFYWLATVHPTHRLTHVRSV